MKSSFCGLGIPFTGRFPHAEALAAVMALGLSCQPDSHREAPRSEENSKAEVASQDTDVLPPSDLILQFSDDFNQEYEAPHRFDMTHWIKWSGDAWTENGYAMYSTGTTPGKFGTAGIGTREKYFNPGLRGTNGVEVTFVGYVQLEDAPEPTAEEARMLGIEHGIVPLAPLYLTGMAVTISNVYGQLALPEEGVRTVQLHFDVTKNWGLNWWLARSIMLHDAEKRPAWYPAWDGRLKTLREFLEKGNFTAAPFFALAGRHDHPVDMESPFGRRVGLYLTDDGNTIYWTLDGKVMDRVDITGFFSSSPESVKDGAYVTISGAGYQPHIWKVDDVAIYASP